MNDRPAVETTLQERMMNVSRLATIGEMAAGLAHEINQPLTAVVTYAQASERVLNQPQPDFEDLREALQQIAAEAMRAADIIRRLRALARLRPPEREASDINAVVVELIEFTQTDARVHDVNLRFEPQQGLPAVLVDRVQIQHVLLNLTRNAIEALKSVPAGRRELTVSTSLTPERDVEVSLRDTGPGVPADQVERIFDPFFSTKPEGTGLGLAISTTILREHGGALRYRPNTPTGACFTMRIPSK
jgi:two-component system, LuxR family, sensor kinase FixL